MNILFSTLPVYCARGVPTRLSLTFHTLTPWLCMVSGPIFKELFQHGCMSIAFPYVLTCLKIYY